MGETTQTVPTSAKQWTEAEDQVIYNTVRDYGEKVVSIVSSQLGRRMKQIRQRYDHNVSSDIVRSDWTPNEDILLLELVVRYGYRWSLFPRFFEKKGANYIRLHWEKSLKKLVEAPDEASFNMIKSQSRTHPVVADMIEKLKLDTKFLASMNKPYVGLFTNSEVI